MNIFEFVGRKFDDFTNAKKGEHTLAGILIVGAALFVAWYVLHRLGVL